MYTQRMDRFINSIQIRNRCRPDQNESPRVKKNGQLVEWTCYYRWCIVKPFLWIVLCHTHNFPSFFCICRLCWASVRMLYYCVPNQLRQNRKFWLWLTFIVWSAREKKEREGEREWLRHHFSLQENSTLHLTSISLIWILQWIRRGAKCTK